MDPAGGGIVTDLDRETTAAVRDLASRIRNLDPEVDPDLFAREFMLALRGRGWRLTEARKRTWRPQPASGSGGLPTGTEAAELLRKARADAETARDAFQAEHRDNPDHGAAI
jgi:hypothetical protein